MDSLASAIGYASSPTRGLEAAMAFSSRNAFPIFEAVRADLSVKASLAYQPLESRSAKTAGFRAIGVADSSRQALRMEPSDNHWSERDRDERETLDSELRQDVSRRQFQPGPDLISVQLAAIGE